MVETQKPGTEDILRAIAFSEFSLRQQIVLAVIYDAGFRAGKTKAYLPGLGLIARAARISEGNVSVTLKELKRRHVIGEEPKDNYFFKLPSKDWKVPLRIDMAVLDEILALQFPLPNCLNEALRESHLEDISRQTAEGANVGGLPAVQPPPGQPALAESISNPAGPGSQTKSHPAAGSSAAAPQQAGFPNREPEAARVAGSQIGNRGALEQGSQIGNPVKKPPNRPVERANPEVPESGTGANLGGVPESGTSLAILQLEPCKIVSSKEQISKVPSPAAPVSRKLTPELQRIFDDLREAGAIAGETDYAKRCSEYAWLSFVRTRPAVAVELLGELRYAQTTRKVANPGGFMMDKWIRWGRPDKP